MAGGMSNLLDFKMIDQRIDGLEYDGVMDVVADVQLVLRGAMQYYASSHEVLCLILYSPYVVTDLASISSLSIFPNL